MPSEYVGADVILHRRARTIHHRQGSDAAGLPGRLN